MFFDYMYTGSSSMATEKMWLPGKGPQWEHFGWQLAQQGAAPDTHAGQLITDPSGKYVLARASAPDPFPGCGPGDTGWVNITDGKLGCMEVDANVIPAQQCNGFEVAYCKACLPCPPVYK